MYLFIFFSSPAREGRRAFLLYGFFLSVVAASGDGKRALGERRHPDAGCVAVYIFFRLVVCFSLPGEWFVREVWGIVSGERRSEPKPVSFSSILLRRDCEGGGGSAFLHAGKGPRLEGRLVVVHVFLGLLLLVCAEGFCVQAPKSSRVRWEVASGCKQGTGRFSGLDAALSSPPGVVITRRFGRPGFLRFVEIGLQGWFGES